MKTGAAKTDLDSNSLNSYIVYGYRWTQTAWYTNDLNGIHATIVAGRLGVVLIANDSLVFRDASLRFLSEVSLSTEFGPIGLKRSQRRIVR